MTAFDRERARLLNDLETVCRVANQMRLLLAKDDVDTDARARAEEVLSRQIPEMKRLSSMLSKLDDLAPRSLAR